MLMKNEQTFQQHLEFDFRPCHRSSIIDHPIQMKLELNRMCRTYHFGLSSYDLASAIRQKVMYGNNGNIETKEHTPLTVSLFVV